MSDAGTDTEWYRFHQTCHLAVPCNDLCDKHDKDTSVLGLDSLYLKMQISDTIVVRSVKIVDTPVHQCSVYLDTNHEICISDFVPN